MRWGVVVLVILSFVAEASGGAARVTPSQAAKQPVATAPVDAAWAAVVDRFARALADSDAETLASLLSDTVVIQSFEHRLSDPLRLLGRTRKGELLSCRTYIHPGLTIASDVADDIRSARIPEEIRRRLSLRDEHHAKRANSIAYHWVASALEAKAGDTVTVMAFWRDRSADEARADGARSELVWVLVKAELQPVAQEETAQRAAPRIRQIAFGDPQRTVR